MDLETMVVAKAGTKVMVNGTLYEIDGECVLKGASKEDAEKLLQNPNWKVYEGKTNRAVPDGHQRAKPSVKLIDSAGGEVPGQKEEVVDPPIPDDDGGEWADPSPEYSMEWLKACAEAYEVSYRGKDKGKLCEKIKAAMYE